MNKPPKRGEGIRQRAAVHRTVLAENKNVWCKGLDRFLVPRLLPSGVSGRVNWMAGHHPALETREGAPSLS